MILQKICLALPMAIRITRSVSVGVSAQKKNRKMKSKAEDFWNFQSVTKDRGFYNLEL